METLAARLKDLCLSNNEEGLKGIALELGYAEPGKTMANLSLLYELFGSENLLARIAKTALTAADPDLALNNLERLANNLDTEKLHLNLNDDRRRQQLLTILGASQFLTGILCRDKSFFQTLFIDKAIDHGRTDDRGAARFYRRRGQLRGTAVPAAAVQVQGNPEDRRPRPEPHG